MVSQRGVRQCRQIKQQLNRKMYDFVEEGWRRVGRSFARMLEGQRRLDFTGLTSSTDAIHALDRKLAKPFTETTAYAGRVAARRIAAVSSTRSGSSATASASATAAGDAFPRKRARDVGHLDDDTEDAKDVRTHTKRPPKPAEPVLVSGVSTKDVPKTKVTKVKTIGSADAHADADGEVASPTTAAGAMSASRRKDKDIIPAPETWDWDSANERWKLVPRPRPFQRSMFFAYTPIPMKQQDLLHFMLTSSTPIDTDFLRTELVPRLNRTHPVSLRLLDWLVVDYAPQRGIAYRMYVPALGRETIVVMHALYTTWLNRWRRSHYDPFRRRHRIYFELDGETYSTTVAQLHFFYMARMFGFLEYASRHLDDILPHMKAVLAETNTRKEEARRRGELYRRKPLVEKARARAYLSRGKFKLTFCEGDAESPGAITGNDSDMHAIYGGLEQNVPEDDDEDDEDQEDADPSVDDNAML